MATGTDTGDAPASGQGLAPVRLGVLGCASIAWRRMLPALAARPELELVAVASRELSKAAQFTDEFGGEAVQGYEQLLARDDVEAVYVPLPIMLHAEWVERALRAGKHVLCEKPLTRGLADAERLVKLADELGLTLMESLMFVRHSQHTAVRELLDSGTIGELRSLTAEFAFPPKPAGDMRYDAVSGGALAEIGVYPFATALLHLGDDLRVLGAAVRRDAKGDVDLSGAALLTTPDGTTAHLTWGMEHAYRSVYELWGSAGRIVVEWAYTPPSTHPPVIRVETQDRQERRTLPPDDQFGNVLAAFARAVRTGEDNGLQGEEILRLAALMDKAGAHAVALPGGDGE
ncbi:gfo/Idh/MocA family oxidoreductase [Streptomyces armeniacus]|uniref:Gfo/Idh/MocA family oxidoreductase n=1 Tax=Streptomyces armeniacus TaxID=83291 RepID=A0A345XUA6_9ACTN|nr:Gfo/Idh/MocA family oxidoreductase [Streptomyces armeniacus]AXK35222.1 gfo/Idh/MocA family oxidoreductase [Streptomyces armeniacus]